MTLDEYLSSLAGKRIAVVGYGVSNAPLTELLLSHGCDVTVRDKRTPLEFADAEILKERGAKLPAEHNYGRIYKLPESMEEHFKELDPTNTFNAGIGGTSPHKDWA